MKELLIITFSLLITSFSYAQEEDLIKVYSDTTIYHDVDTLASYTNGMSNMMQYLAKHIKYPEETKDYPVQSSFYIQFVVEINGNISNVKPSDMKKSPTKLDFLFVKENERIFLNMPKWKPAIYNGEKVRSIYTIPLHVHWK